MFYRNGVKTIKVLHCGSRDFRPFCSCDLAWPIFNRDMLDVQIWTSYIKAFESYCLTERQTQPNLHTRPLRTWSYIQKITVINWHTYTVHTEPLSCKPNGKWAWKSAKIIQNYEILCTTQVSKNLCTVIVLRNHSHLDHQFYHLWICHVTYKLTSH